MADPHELTAPPTVVNPLAAEQYRLGHIISPPDVSINPEGLASAIGLVLALEDRSRQLAADNIFDTNSEPQELPPAVKTERDNLFLQLLTASTLLGQLFDFEQGQGASNWDDVFNTIRAVEQQERGQAVALVVAEELGGEALKNVALVANLDSRIPRITATDLLETTFPGINHNYLAYRRVAARIGEDAAQKTCPELYKRAQEWRADFDARRTEPLDS